MPLAERELKALRLTRDSLSREYYAASFRSRFPEEAALLAHTGPYGAVGQVNPSPYPSPYPSPKPYPNQGRAAPSRSYLPTGRSSQVRLRLGLRLRIRVSVRNRA
jgi:hypothetical protein